MQMDKTIPLSTKIVHLLSTIMCTPIDGTTHLANTLLVNLLERFSSTTLTKKCFDKWVLITSQNGLG